MKKFEELNDNEKCVFNKLIESLYSFGRHGSSAKKIKSYPDTVEEVKSEIGENACCDILDVLRTEGYIFRLTNGVTALTEKGIKYATETLKL